MIVVKPRYKELYIESLYTTGVTYLYISLLVLSNLCDCMIRVYIMNKTSKTNTYRFMRTHIIYLLIICCEAILSSRSEKTKHQAFRKTSLRENILLKTSHILAGAP
jgi:hypothetical protein